MQAARGSVLGLPRRRGATETDLGKGCSPRPPSEIVDPLSTSVVDFEDPAGVKGTGDPSGGQDPANGLMTYSSDDGGARLLPRDVHPSRRMSTRCARRHSTTSSRSTVKDERELGAVRGLPGATESLTANPKQRYSSIRASPCYSRISQVLPSISSRAASRCPAWQAVSTIT